MAFATDSIISRIEWCRMQRAQARTSLEFERWRAEEEGLRDAILQADRTNQFRQSPPDVFERYAMGLQDGQVLIRAGFVDKAFDTSRDQKSCG
jgi:hypothetical protein